jgi:hypothetical protein
MTPMQHLLLLGEAYLIVYSSDNGNLFYNQNGVASGLVSGAEFASLSGIPALSANDFVLQA